MVFLDFLTLSESYSRGLLGFFEKCYIYCCICIYVEEMLSLD